MVVPKYVSSIAIPIKYNKTTTIPIINKGKIIFLNKKLKKAFQKYIAKTITPIINMIIKIDENVDKSLNIKLELNI